jgi:hypothetical protein
MVHRSFRRKQALSEERAKMLVRLGLKRSAYDWRAQHVQEFEEEILHYKKHGIEFFAFWKIHEKAFELFQKYKIHPQIWKTLASPKSGTQEEKIRSAKETMIPLAKRTTEIGCKLGLYNHGGWGGEPENLVAVCKALRAEGHDHVGIVYNWHHGHGRIEEWKQDLDLMLPYLHCLNLNGMNTGARPKILELGKGEHEQKMLKVVLESGYKGPVGILDHQNELDAEESLQANLTGLDSLLGKINSLETKMKPCPSLKTVCVIFIAHRHKVLLQRRTGTIQEPYKPFPGLDGGGWGHWGQNPESNNTDTRLNEMDFEGVLMQATNHAGGLG